MGRKSGLSDEKLHAVRGDDMTPFNDMERLVIELADAITQTLANVSDDLYARLRNQFSEEQLMQLGAHIAFENYRARWNRQRQWISRKLEGKNSQSGLPDALVGVFGAVPYVFALIAMLFNAWNSDCIDLTAAC